MPDSVILATAPLTANPSGLQLSQDEIGNPVILDWEGNEIETPIVIGNCGVGVNVDAELL